MGAAEDGEGGMVVLRDVERKRGEGSLGGRSRRGEVGVVGEEPMFFERSGAGNGVSGDCEIVLGQS